MWHGRDGYERKIAATVTRGAVGCSAWLGRWCFMTGRDSGKLLSLLFLFAAGAAPLCCRVVWRTARLVIPTLIFGLPCLGGTAIGANELGRAKMNGVKV